MTSTNKQGLGNAPKIAIQTITPDRADKPERYILLINPQGGKSTKSKWNSASGAWDVNLAIPLKPVMDIIFVEIIEHHRVRRDKRIGTGKLSIKELQIAAEGGTKEFRTSINVTSDLATTELDLTLQLSVDAALVSSSAVTATANLSSHDSKNILLMQTPSSLDSSVPEVASSHMSSPMTTLPFDAMIKQSTECCIFISGYSSGRYFKRLVGNLSASQKIQEFKSTFQDLRKQLDDTLLCVATATTLELHESFVAIRAQLEDLGHDLKLQNLETTELSPREPCLPGTHQNTLSTITDWILQGKESILWLSGVAGCGKSSVMATLNDQLINMGCSSQLATFIHFDHFDFNNPSLFVKTLAHQLVSFDSQLGNIITDVLRT